MSVLIQTAHRSGSLEQRMWHSIVHCFGSVGFGRNLADVGPISAGFDQIWVGLNRIRAEVGQHSVGFDRIWGDAGHLDVGAGHIRADFGPTSAKSGVARTTVVLVSAQPRPVSTRLNWGGVGHSWAVWRKLGQDAVQAWKDNWIEGILLIAKRLVGRHHGGRLSTQRCPRSVPAFSQQQRLCCSPLRASLFWRGALPVMSPGSHRPHSVLPKQPVGLCY